eukprot:TRINITY_DN2388_c0_g1_i1.p1 TRINITY_DN2388_c0_g1~~TRINITY_DN2388_c0_g1_i1.p1  ORF type:complete len:156 (-),score=48.19 TRINITY_DN2388_c0_g1_i1:62-529(-)
MEENVNKAEALEQLGNIYNNEEGFKDFEKAASLYEKVIEINPINDGVLFNLFVLYQKGGLGLESNQEKSNKYLEESAKLGNDFAIKMQNFMKKSNPTQNKVVFDVFSMKDDLEKCANCKSVKNLKGCSRCKKVKYCNRECQVAHWKVHKIDCQQK